MANKRVIPLWMWVVPLFLGVAGLMLNIRSGNAIGAALAGFCVGIVVCRLIYESDLYPKDGEE